MTSVTIVGGCGFIGSNLAAELVRDGYHVTLFDNLSRPGSEKNLAWLQEIAGENLRFVHGDVRNQDEMEQLLENDCSAVFHFAGQVAVTRSVACPREDFEVNALGTLNVLEAIRQSGTNPAFLYTSTNKVYGSMPDVAVVERDGRYAYADSPQGISEDQQLDFHSPYGCSKGAADQYVRDYARIYGIRSVVFRMSCQYGVRQFGNEDQGWVAHFAIAAYRHQPITIFGDGKQVRDVLYISDLVRAFRLAMDRINDVSGQVYNVGGGPENQLSLLELVGQLEQLLGYRLDVTFSNWRPGDQRVYVSDITRIQRALGWNPKISPSVGVQRLVRWVQTNGPLFEDAT